MTDGVGKRKRLSLKNKKPTLQSAKIPDNDSNGNVCKKRKIASAITSSNLKNIPEENVQLEIICLSDVETGNCKQVKLRSNATAARSILDIPDEQLRELRRQLLALRGRESYTAYIRQLPELELPETEKISGSRESTAVASLASSDQEYSPLPQMCLACAHRKPINHDFDSVMNTILNSSHNDNSSSHNDNSSSHNDNSSSHNDNSSSDGNSPKILKRTESCPPKQSTSSSDCDRTGEAVVTSKSPVLDFDIMSDFEEDILMSDIEERDKMKKCGKGKQDVTKTNEVLKHGPSSSVDVDTSAPICEVNLLSACPLCSMEFEKGTSQLDIDGHIAACLSAAGDDATW
ncbi:uncharacterized protein LOC124287278 [Haliotis rubra]|uniref:uncharacterized protein LOC124287278 n=1 Tax=Haliotis rubra TaxID=36100 RepID=UPI001EE53172|nr:uncharacterized protein LOC124287278 [Haliotis rubra]